MALNKTFQQIVDRFTQPHKMGSTGIKIENMLFDFNVEPPKSTQNNLILAHMKCGYTITPLSALKLFNCLRLSARIKNLRDRGFDIETRIILNNGKRYAEYSLKKQSNE